MNLTFTTARTNFFFLFPTNKRNSRRHEAKGNVYRTSTLGDFDLAFVLALSWAHSFVLFLFYFVTFLHSGETWSGGE